MGSDDESGSSKDPSTRKKFIEEKSPGDDDDGANKSTTSGLTISQMEQAIKNAQHSYHREQTSKHMKIFSLSILLRMM